MSTRLAKPVSNKRLSLGPSVEGVGFWAVWGKETKEGEGEGEGEEGFFFGSLLHAAPSPATTAKAAMKNEFIRRELMEGPHSAKNQFI
jgi:hypothetical protein